MNNMYKVQKDDTLSKVAWEHGVDVKDIITANPQLINERYIRPQQTLTIPRSKFPRSDVEKEGMCIKEFSPTDLKKYISFWKNNMNDLPFKIETIGYSVLNEPLYLLKIGRGKKKVFYSAGWHANEWMTSKFLTEWSNKLLHCLKNEHNFFDYDLKSIFKEVTLYVVPIVNPDGISLVLQGNDPSHPYYEFINHTNKHGESFDHWSANIRGVDLNHQWPAGWEKEAKGSPQQPWPRHFSGVEPLTEPEAKAIYLLTRKENFSYVLAFHSQGQLIYWGYKDLEPSESEEMVERLSLKSSYLPVHTADSDGGYKDWFIQETGRAGFTIEVGIGTNPLPFQAYGEIWSNNVLLALEGLHL